MKPNFAILVPNFNGEGFILQTVRLLSNGFPNSKIIVIDDASTDNSVALLKSNGINVVQRTFNKGFGAAVNTGLLYLKDNGVHSSIVCNSDLVASVEECKNIQRAIDDIVEDSEVGIIGFLESNDFFPRLKEPSDISGFIFWIKLSIVDKVGFFDEQFYMYGEETEFFRRVVRAGYKIAQSGVTVSHAAEKSGKSRIMNSWYAIRNALLLEIKGGRKSRVLPKAGALLLIIFGLLGDKNDPSTIRVRRPGYIIGPLMVAAAICWSIYQILQMSLRAKEAPREALANADSSDYFSRSRTWPALFDVKSGGSILDIGCGKGRLGSFLKVHCAARVTGIEIYPAYAEVASKHLDEVLCGDVEKLNLDAYIERFDCIIFSDSLEHLVEPELALLKVKALLQPDGILLLSVPNVRNFRVTIPLVMLGNFEYQDEGLLDRTHLRFFTRSSITNLLQRCGFEVEVLKYDLPLKSKVGLLNIVSLGLFRETLTSHFFIQSCKIKS